MAVSVVTENSQPPLNSFALKEKCAKNLRKLLLIKNLPQKEKEEIQIELNADLKNNEHILILDETSLVDIKYIIALKEIELSEMEAKVISLKIRADRLNKKSYLDVRIMGLFCFIILAGAVLVGWCAYKKFDQEYMVIKRTPITKRLA